MTYSYVNLILSALLAISFSAHAQSEELRCFAGIQPDPQKNEYVSEKKPEHFGSENSTVIRFGESHPVKTYRVELEGFVVEGLVYIRSGIAPELRITDQASGVTAEVQEHGQVRLALSSARSTGPIRIAASCSRQ